MKMKKVKAVLKQSIQALNECKDYFVTKPLKDYSRKGKLLFDRMIESILCMGAGTLSNEMMDFFGFSDDLATTSAFVQKRAKILPEAFESLFDLFTKEFAEAETYRGFQLLAVDGSDFLTAANPDDPDSYFPGKEDQKPYNLLHLNALYDVVRHIYIDALLQKRRCADECSALVSMTDRSLLKNVLLMADRGYESYNVLAHIQEKGWKFLFRVKNGTGGIVSGLNLPDDPIFDVPFTLNLTNKQSNEVKSLLKDKNRYRFIPNTSRFDFLPKHSKWHDPAVFYPLSFRIVRFPISENTYETVITNLEADDFPPADLKKLYAMRWGIETSFRELKYTVGLQ
ncbi:MAG: IS4 family transposase, partial [Ruminococcus sp.]|nr:IS4 family transposase [Ruminococcus sp.]